MLRGLRNVSSNWLGKSIMSLMFGVLIISFGVWGIADIFKGYGSSSVASVGNTEISTEQFRQSLTDKLQQISRQAGRPLTMDQARAFGLDRQLLQQTIAEASLDEQARRLGLTLSDAEIVRIISGDPTFAGLNGKFDPQRFALALRQFGYTEPRYIAEQRRVSLRRQLVSGIVAGLQPSNTQLEALTRFQNEQRGIEYVKLGAAQAGTIAAPTNDVLTSYFDERKALFRAPEYRKVAYLVVSPDSLAKGIVVSDEDARKYFDQNKTNFVKPDRRNILQISFQSPAEAKTARDRIAAGLSFEDLAKEMKLSNSDIDLGLVDKNSLSDKTIADAAFALPLNEVSQPVTGTLATVLMKVTKIEPGSTATYESTADTIKKQIAADRARGNFDDLRNKIEDERGGGANIVDAAQKVGLSAVTVDVDRSGRTADGKQVDLPKGVDLVSAAFGSDVGVENDPLTFPGGEVWFDVLGVAPSHDRTFDEVKDQVTSRWRADQIATRLRTKATDLTDKLNKGGVFATEASGAGLTVEKSPLFTREVKLNGLPDQVVDTAFQTAKGTAAQAQGLDGNEIIVFKVTDINSPKVDLNSDAVKQLKTSLTGNLTDEQIGQYVAHLESEIGVKVNQSAYAVATGAASSNQ
jgi:peptidyl-prolyl cis-trans isomerase D